MVPGLAFWSLRVVFDASTTQHIKKWLGTPRNGRFRCRGGGDANRPHVDDGRCLKAHRGKTQNSVVPQAHNRFQQIRSSLRAQNTSDQSNPSVNSGDLVMVMTGGLL